MLVKVIVVMISTETQTMNSLLQETQIKRFVIPIFLFLLINLFHQPALALVNTYDVSRFTSVTYTSIAGTGTAVSSWRNGTNTDDNLSNSIPIGFNFTYDGGVRTAFLVSTNGFITFNTATASDGSGTAANYSYTNAALSSGTAPLSNLLVAPFYEDMVCQGNSSIQPIGIYYQLTGVAGSRVMTIQWTEMEIFDNPGPNLNFQVKLYEGSNNIEFLYGNFNSFNGTINLVYSYSVGLNSATISSTPLNGEVFNQLTADSRNFGLTASYQLSVSPACYSLVRFTPGVYTPYVPASTVPVNNDTSGAILLNVNPSVCLDLCGTYYSTVGATASTGIPVCGVGTSNPDDDIWFKFVAINPNTTIKVVGAGNYDPTLQLLNRSKDTTLACGNNTAPGLSETLNMTTLIVGRTYFVRVYHRGVGYGVTSSGQFSICVSATPLPPVNDECANSITLPVSATMTVGTSTVAGTASSGIPTCVLNGENPDDDVWYKFTATKAIAIITVQANSGFNPVIQLFSGSCGSFSSITCLNNSSSGQTETLIAYGLTINALYHFRVFHAGIGGGTGSYSLSVSSPPPSCSTLTLPPNSTTDVPTSGIDLLWESVVGADNYKILFDTVNPPVFQLTATVDTFVNTGFLAGGKTYYWRVITGNGNSYTTNCPVDSFSTEYLPYALNIRVFLQGYMDGPGVMKSDFGPSDTMATTIEVNLIDIEGGSTFRQLARLSRNGWAKPFFPAGALENNYYIVINHKNHLEIWSKNLVPFYTPDTTYIFSTSDTTVYGNNQVNLGSGIYGMYVGDVNQDQFIDSLDYQVVTESARQFETFGENPSDLNIDRSVESVDLSILENQIRLSLFVIFPVGGAAFAGH
jgi:hypothetical protein